MAFGHIVSMGMHAIEKRRTIPVSRHRPRCDRETPSHFDASRRRI